MSQTSEPTLVDFQGTVAVLSDQSTIEFPEGTVPLFRPDVFSFPGPEGYLIRCGSREARVRHQATKSDVQKAVDTLAGRSS